METIEQEVVRMGAVIDKAKSAKERMGLMARLIKSEKFSGEAKPACMILLLSSLIKTLPDAKLSELVDAVRSAEVMEFFKPQSPEKAQAARALVNRMLTATPKTTKDLLQILRQMQAAGITADRMDLIGLALDSGMSPEAVGEICDLTWRVAYHLEPEPA